MEEEVSGKNQDSLAEAPKRFSSEPQSSISSVNSEKEDCNSTVLNKISKKDITVHTLTVERGVDEILSKSLVHLDGDDKAVISKEKQETSTEISSLSKENLHGTLTVLYTSPNKTDTFNKKSHSDYSVVSQDMSSSDVLPQMCELSDSRGQNSSLLVNDQKSLSDSPKVQSETIDSGESRIAEDTASNPNNNNNNDKSLVTGPAASQAHLIPLTSGLNVGRQGPVTASSVSACQVVDRSPAAGNSLARTNANLQVSDSLISIKSQSPRTTISYSKQYEHSKDLSPIPGSRKSPIGTMQNEQLSSLIHKASTLIHGEVVQPYPVFSNTAKSPVPTNLFPGSQEQRDISKTKTSVISSPVQKKTATIKCQEETSHQLKNFLLAPGPVEAKTSNVDTRSEMTNQPTDSMSSLQATGGRQIFSHRPPSQPHMQFEKANQRKQPADVPQQSYIPAVISTGQGSTQNTSNSTPKAVKKKSTRPPSSKGKDLVEKPVAEAGDNEEDEDEDSDFIPVGMLQLSTFKREEAVQLGTTSASEVQHESGQAVSLHSQQTVYDKEKEGSLRKSPGQMNYLQQELEQQLLQHMKQQQQKFAAQQSDGGQSKLSSKIQTGKERQELLREQGGMQLKQLAHVVKNDQEEKQTDRDPRHQQHQLLLQLVHQAQQQQKQLLEQQQQQQAQPAQQAQGVSDNPTQSHHSSSEETHASQGFHKNQGLVIHHQQQSASYVKQARNMQTSIKKEKVEEGRERAAQIESHTCQASPSGDVQSASSYPASQAAYQKQESLKQLGQSNVQQQLVSVDVPKIAEQPLQQSELTESLTCGRTELTSQYMKEEKDLMQSKMEEVVNPTPQHPATLRTDQVPQRSFTPTPMAGSHLHPSLNQQHPEIAKMLNSPVSPRQPSSPRQSVSPRRPMSPHHSAVSPSHFASPKQPVSPHSRQSVSPRQSSFSKPVVSPQSRSSSSPWQPVSPSQSSPVSPAHFVSLGQSMSSTGSVGMTQQPYQPQNHQSLMDPETTHAFGTVGHYLSQKFDVGEKQQQPFQSKSAGQSVPLDSGQRPLFVTYQDQYQVADTDTGPSPLSDSPSPHHSNPSSFTSQPSQAFSPGQIIHHRPSAHKNTHSKLTGLPRLPLSTSVQLPSPSVPSSTSPMSSTSVPPSAQTASPIWQQLQTSDDKTRANASHTSKVVGLFSSQPVDIQKLAKQQLVQHAHQPQMIKSTKPNPLWDNKSKEMQSQTSLNSATELKNPECSQHSKTLSEKQTIEMQLYPSATIFTKAYSANSDTIENLPRVVTSGQTRSFQGMTSLTEKETSLIESLFASGNQNVGRQEAQASKELGSQSQSHSRVPDSVVMDKSRKIGESSSLMDMRMNEGGLKVLSEIASERYQLAVAGKDDLQHSIAQNIKERRQEFVPRTELGKTVVSEGSMSSVSESLSNIQKHNIQRQMLTLSSGQHSNSSFESNVNESTFSPSKVTGKEREKSAAVTEASRNEGKQHAVDSNKDPLNKGKQEAMDFAKTQQNKGREAAMDTNKMPHREVRQRKPKKPFEQDDTPSRRNSKNNTPNQKATSNSGKKSVQLNTGPKPSHKKGQSQRQQSHLQQKNDKAADEGKFADQTKEDKKEATPANQKDKVNMLELDDSRTANSNKTEAGHKRGQKVKGKEKIDVTSKATLEKAADSQGHPASGTDSDSNSRRLSQRLKAKVKDKLESNEDEKDDAEDRNKRRPARRSTRVNYKEDGGSDSVEAPVSRKTSISSDDVGQTESSSQRIMTRSKNRKTEDDDLRDNDSKPDLKVSDSGDNTGQAVSEQKTAFGTSPKKGDNLTPKNDRRNKSNGSVSSSRSRSPVDNAKVSSTPRRMTTRRAVTEKEKSHSDTVGRSKRLAPDEFVDELPQWRKRIKRSETSKNSQGSDTKSPGGQTPVKTDFETLNRNLEPEGEVSLGKIGQVLAQRDVKKKVKQSKTPNVAAGGEGGQSQQKQSNRNEQVSLQLKEGPKSFGDTSVSKSDMAFSKPRRSLTSRKDKDNVTGKQHSEPGEDGMISDTADETKGQGYPVIGHVQDLNPGIRDLRSRNMQASPGRDKNPIKPTEKPAQQTVIKSTSVLPRSSAQKETRQKTCLASSIATDSSQGDSKEKLLSYYREKNQGQMPSAGEKRKMIMYKLVPVQGEDVSDLDEALVPISGYYIPGGTRDCILLPHDFMEGPLTSKMSSSSTTLVNTSDQSKALPAGSWTNSANLDHSTSAMPTAHSLWSADEKLQHSSVSKVTESSDFSSLRVALTSTVESTLPSAISSATWSSPSQQSSSLASSSTWNSQLPPPLPTPPPSIGEPAGSQCKRTWSAPPQQSSPSPYRPSPSWNTTPPSILSPSPLPSSSSSTAWNLSSSSSTLPLPPSQQQQSWSGPTQPSVQDSSWRSSPSVTAAAIESWSKEFFPSTVYSSSVTEDQRRTEPVFLGPGPRGNTIAQQPYNMGSGPSQQHNLYTSNLNQPSYNPELQPDSELTDTRPDTLIQGFLRQVSSNPGGFSQELAGFNLGQQDFAYLENRLRQAFSPNTLMSAVAAYDDNSGHGTAMSHENSLQESINLVHTVNLDMEEENLDSSANLELSTLSNVSSANMTLSKPMGTTHNLASPETPHETQVATPLCSPTPVDKSLPPGSGDGKADAKKIIRERKHQYEIVTIDGIRKYKCLVCSKYLGNATIYRHLRTHDPDYKVTCELCGKQYTQRHSLSLHMRKFHADQGPRSALSPTGEELSKTGVDKRWTVQSPKENLPTKSGSETKRQRRTSSASDSLGTSLDQVELEKQLATHRQVEELRRMKAEKKLATALKKKADQAMDETIAAVAGGHFDTSLEESSFDVDPNMITEGGHFEPSPHATSANVDSNINARELASEAQTYPVDPASVNEANSQRDPVSYSKMSTLSSDHSQLEVASRGQDFARPQFQLNSPQPVMSTLPQLSSNSVQAEAKNQLTEGETTQESSLSDVSDPLGPLPKAIITEDGKHMCRICGSCLNTRNGYLLHMRRHRKIKSKFCSYCEKGFHTGQELRSHERTHTGERPYKCHLCYTTFAHSGSYVAHKKGHAKRGETTPFSVVDGKIQYPSSFQIPRIIKNARKKKHKKTPVDTQSLGSEDVKNDSHLGQDQNECATQPTSVIRRHSLDVNSLKPMDQGTEMISRRLSLHESPDSMNPSSFNRSDTIQTPLDKQIVNFTDQDINLSHDSRANATFGPNAENFPGQTGNMRSSEYYSSPVSYSQALQHDYPSTQHETTQDYYRQDKFSSSDSYGIGTPTMPVNLAIGKTQPLAESLSQSMTESLTQPYSDSNYYPCQQQPHYDYNVEASDRGFQQDEYQARSYKSDSSSSEIVKKLLQHYNVPSSTYQTPSPVDYSHQMQPLPVYNRDDRETVPPMYTNTDMEAAAPPSYSTSMDQKQYYNTQVKTGITQQTGQDLQESDNERQTQGPGHDHQFQNPQPVVPIESFDHPSRYSSYRDSQFNQTPGQSYP